MNYTYGLVPTCLSTLLLACAPTTQGAPVDIQLIESGEASTTTFDPQDTLQEPTLAPLDSAEQLNAAVRNELASGQAVGGLEVRLIDAPLDADSVDVTLCDLEVQAKEQGSWRMVANACLSVDLLSLQGGLFESLGMAALPVGQYGQVRMKLTESSVTVDGQVHHLEVPSSTKTGLKFKGEFELREGEVTTLTLDFDANKSVHKTGQGEYKMSPVIFLAESTSRLVPSAEPNEAIELDDNIMPDPGSYQPCPATGPCNILPLGDSITYGYIPHSGASAGGYRVELFRLALAANKEISFTGAQPPNGPAQVDGTSFPQKHGGISGQLIAEIDERVPTPALDELPHIVLVHAGTNDMFRAPHGASDRLGTLLDNLIVEAPDALIVVSSIIPIGFYSTNIEEFNASIPTLVAERATEGAHILFLDQSAGFPLSELGDNVHPDVAGYERMAGVWFDGISSYLR